MFLNTPKNKDFNDSGALRQPNFHFHYPPSLEIFILFCPQNFTFSNTPFPIIFQQKRKLKKETLELNDSCCLFFVNFSFKQKRIALQSFCKYFFTFHVKIKPTTF